MPRRYHLVARALDYVLLRRRTGVTPHERKDRMTGDQADAPGASSSGERRRYNRRTTEVTPPYFDAFERIAVALEGIRDLLVSRAVVLPRDSDAPAGPRKQSQRS